jgi:AraC-like DNA-binding protein
MGCVRVGRPTTFASAFQPVETCVVIRIDPEPRLPVLSRPIRLDAAPADFLVSPKAGDGFDLHYVLRGRVEILQNGGQFGENVRCGPHVLIIRNPSNPTGLGIKAGTSLLHLHFRLPHEAIALGTLDAIGRGDTLPISGHLLHLPDHLALRGSAARHIVAQLTAVQRDYDGAGHARLRAAYSFLTVLTQISDAVRCATNETGTGRLGGSRPGRLVARAVGLIEMNYSRPMSVAQIARAIRVTPEYLNRIFASHVGHSVGVAIAQRRLSVACRLLHHSDLSIKEIATACGFRDALYFSRFFKRSQGVTPSQFSSRARTEQADKSNTSITDR